MAEIDSYASVYSSLEESNTNHQVEGINASSECRYRKTRDSIHGMITFDRYIWGIIDTPQFQRMRDIKQLGSTHLVFHSANHTRFEHQIGVAHLTDKILDNIFKQHQKDSQGISFEDMFCFRASEQQHYKMLIEVAGLCHDLGHGPFSHMFDQQLLPRLGVHDWHHEQGSKLMFENLLENEQLKQLKEFDEIYNSKNFISDIIQGRETSQKSLLSNEPLWVYEVIANKNNSIDVDKFDYLSRDAYHLGLKGYDFQWDQLMADCRVIDNTICFDIKTNQFVYDLYNVRYRMFKNIYQHRVTQAVDLMICDALVEANPYFRFNEIINDPKLYLHLTDNVLQEIASSDLYKREYNGQKISQKSRDIVARIKNRNLYKCVSSHLVDAQSKLDTKEIEKFIEQQRVPGIQKTDYEIICNVFNYCKKDQDPIQWINFYSHKNLKKRQQLQQNDISLLSPKRFQEQQIRAFVKSDNQQLSQNLEKIVEKYIEHLQVLSKNEKLDNYQV